MNPVSLGLNLVLAGLLLATLWLGWRLNGRLKALRAGHADFAAAIADLDRSSRRAEKGLADLRTSTDEAVRMLSGRIEKGRELAGRLERLTADAEAQVGALQSANDAGESKAPSSGVRSTGISPQLAALERIWAKPEPHDELIADETELRSQLQKLSRAFSGVNQPAPAPAPTPLAARAVPRSRALIDEDLFEIGPSVSVSRASEGGASASRLSAGLAGRGGR